MSDEGLKARFAEVSTLAQEGKYGHALARVEELPVGDATKLALRATVLRLAGALPQAVTALQQIHDQKLEVSPARSLKFARLAESVQGHHLSAAFVADAVATASSQEDLEAALEVADELGFTSSAGMAADRLEDLAPQSAVLLDHQVAKARQQGDHQRVAELVAAAGRTEDAAFEIRLAKILDTHRPLYDSVIAALSEEPDRSAAILRSAFIDAQRHRYHLQAVQLLLAEENELALTRPRIAWLISAMSDALLNDHTADPDDLMAALVDVTETALERLSRNPEDGPTRARLGNLLATDESGVLGRFAIRQIFADRAGAQFDASASQSNSPEASNDQLMAFWDAGKNWLKNSKLLVVGRSRASADDLPPGFHAGILREMIHGIEEVARDLGTPGGIEILQNYVAIICGFAHHLDGADQNLDIEALKLAATLLARAGHPQKARDLAETVLQTIDGDPQRARAAWFAYGEVHRMAGDPQEAAIAISAALGCSVSITPTQAWYELLTVHRLARDLGQRELASGILDRAEALPILGQLRQAPSRIETMRLQLELAPVLTNASVESAPLEAYMTRAVAAGRAVLDVNDDPSPIAATLLQTLRFARAHGVPVPDEADDVAADLLAKMPESASQRLSRFSRIPTLGDLVESANELQGARYGRNFAQDVAPLVMLARRHLTRTDLTPSGAAFAIELLADHGLLRRDAAGDELLGDLPGSPDEVLETAKAISRTGLSICLLGFDESDRLVRIDVVDGTVEDPVRESADVFSRRRLIEWRRDYPFHYAYLSAADKHGHVPDAFHLTQLFENTVRGMGVSDLPPQRVVLVTDAGLADLPANLLPVAGAFAGETRTVAVAPSLHWLKYAAQRRMKVRGPSFAWVPTVAAEARDVLPRVAMDLEPTLTKAGIALTQAAEMPPQLKGAELAIVAGHGGLAAIEGRFFRGVADERRNTISGDRLARGLAGSKVAILFICSGGRFDLEPGAQASLGLARMLLDRGCSTVIGSPWPLSGDVPGRWLPTFLEAWSHGIPVADANAFANQAVRGQADSRHALHVYGDPMAMQSPK